MHSPIPPITTRNEDECIKRAADELCCCPRARRQAGNRYYALLLHGVAVRPGLV